MSINDFDKCELLLPMSGANNGTTFTDLSLRKRGITRTGVVTSTAQFKFSAYGASGFFGGATSHDLAVPGFGLPASGNFIIDAWTYNASYLASGNETIVSPNVSGATQGRYLIGLALSTGRARIWAGGTGSFECVGATNGPTGVWAHRRWSRAGNVWRVYLNGVKDAELTSSVSLMDDTTLRIGKYGTFTTESFTGYMQDLMIRFATDDGANFTPPERMAARTLTRTNSGSDSHTIDRAMAFDWAGSGFGRSVVPDADGDFVAADLVDLEYGVVLIKDGCDPICRGPVTVDPD
jgi:hypothetical protein